MWVGGVVGVECIGQKLGAKKIKVVADRENLSLSMEMGDAAHQKTACNGSKGFVLNELQGFEVSGANVGGARRELHT